MPSVRDIPGLMPANPRLLCLRALLEWEKGRSFSDEILHRTFAGQPASSQDRAFVMENFFGILRHLSELDFLIGRLRGPGTLDDQTRSLLRLGLYQLFHLRVPAHAAVNETVDLAKQARGLVNAILRRAVREESGLRQELAKAPREARTSHPEFLLARWEAQFGASATEELAAWDNRPSEVYVRANGLRVTRGELHLSSPAAEPSPFHPSALKVRHLPMGWLLRGLCYVQDPSTLMACDLLAPQPGETVLDLCAAPGGKTSYLAELMQDTGRLIACDLYDSRLERLRENVARLGLRCVEVVQHDAMMPDGPCAAGTVDRILLDAPCSNTGVLRRRVDVRWRLTEEDFIRMPVQQLAMIRRAAALLKPGGSLVYSTCSLEQEENEKVVSQALATVPELRLEETRRALPFRDGVDGAFAARFVREPIC